MNAICIKCWECGGVAMDLNGSCMFRCAECDEEFTRDDVRVSLEAMQKSWGKLLAWADAYPTEEPVAAK